jgi:hypothetical protein
MSSSEEQQQSDHPQFYELEYINLGACFMSCSTQFSVPALGNLQ